MINDNANQQISKLIKPCTYNPIGLYSNEVPMSNVYIGEDSHKNKCFMIKMQSNQLSLKLIDNINKCNQLKCPSLLNYISLSKLKEDYYLVYEYCNGIQLRNYITKAIPNGNKRIMLLIKFVKLLQIFKKNKIAFDYLLIDFIFVDSFENINMKILCCHGLLGYNEATKQIDDDPESVECNDYFNWLSNFIYTISYFNMSNVSEDFNQFFNQFKDDIKQKIKNLFEKVFIKHKEGNSNDYSFELFDSELKVISEKIGLTKPKYNSTKKIFISNRSINNNTIQLQNTITNNPNFTTQPPLNEVNNNKMTQEVNGFKASKFDCNAPQNISEEIIGNNELEDRFKMELKNIETIGKIKEIEMYNNSNINNSNEQFDIRKSISASVNNANAKLYNIPAQFYNSNNISLFQTLNRINCLDQMFSNHVNKINSLWNNIQLYHYNFISQLPVQTSNINQ